MENLNRIICLDYISFFEFNTKNSQEGSIHCSQLTQVTFTDTLLTATYI